MAEKFFGGKVRWSDPAVGHASGNFRTALKGCGWSSRLPRKARHAHESKRGWCEGLSFYGEE
ncbi:hypothetical protein GGTG_06464 [Gaeumannomyces tritici R3-111a-1]|uniref:Uncharacterized protein n=1 Tax=Gaeumannomyces tritici (strain R3-111a-1) TaxID=644352 RepID=J3NYW2_GAET3|nr:hypothetical protein GGTG_06464 [Gaeumannomyces tritici R3-111a-1]EJT76545.1 hypothetical protein GGTG_06464 [Gaeumannomyces tritici R3-111a-1]